MQKVLLTKENIEDYCGKLEMQGRQKQTVKTYYNSLSLLYEYLPEDKTLNKEVLSGWREELLASDVALRTVNHRLSAINSYLEYMGRRDLQMAHASLKKDVDLPELTRDEYHRLLQAAKLQEKERLYLMIKVFATVGLPVQKLSALTLQAVREGRMPKNQKEDMPGSYIPSCLCRELLDYARRQGIKEGSIFLTSSGKPLGREQITMEMKQLCQDARVAEEKVNPRCLRKLCISTKKEMYTELMRLMENDYDRLLEKEQPVYGW